MSCQFFLESLNINAVGKIGCRNLVIRHHPRVHCFPPSARLINCLVPLAAESFWIYRVPKSHRTLEKREAKSDDKSRAKARSDRDGWQVSRLSWEHVKFAKQVQVLSSMYPLSFAFLLTSLVFALLETPKSNVADDIHLVCFHRFFSVG